MADLKAKSRKRWRDRGYHVENGETMMHAPGGIVRRHDVFGFADLIAVPMKAPERPVWDGGAVLPTRWIWIQSTSWSNATARLRKIQREAAGQGQWARPIRELARAVLVRGDLILIEGWRRKKNSRLYEVREIWITMEDLEDDNA